MRWRAGSGAGVEGDVRMGMGVVCGWGGGGQRYMERHKNL